MELFQRIVNGWSYITDVWLCSKYAPEENFCSWQQISNCWFYICGNRLNSEIYGYIQKAGNWLVSQISGLVFINLWAQSISTKTTYRQNIEDIPEFHRADEPIIMHYHWVWLKVLEKVVFDIFLDLLFNMNIPNWKTRAKVTIKARDFLINKCLLDKKGW